MNPSLPMFLPLPIIENTEDELRDFLATMETLAVSKAKEGKPKKTPYIFQGKNGPIPVDSWKFNEFDYSRKVILPCRARGIFTSEGQIVARGYDKFFNVGEVYDLKLENLQQTTGPYDASTKENGCIILVSGLEDGTLLVCSKHSTGEANGFSALHFKRGHFEVYEQLKRSGKLPEDLARLLFKLNLTAVCELCDDDFEEHIVEYPKERAGLYLHGLNYNTKDFATYPMSQVVEFAEEWGFRKVEYETFETFDQLWKFLTRVGEKGIYHGQETEGFVIRCKKDGRDFFFKYKFEEPYFLYRLFRETAKMLIDENVKRTINQIVFRQPKHKHILLLYLRFVEKLFEENPQIKQDFQNELGIIKVRKLFLESNGFTDTDGMKLIDMNEKLRLSERFEEILDYTTFGYFVIPIATIGCGKTTTFKILTELFPTWGHVQNDNLTKPKDFPVKCLDLLNTLPVVFIDRNNHMKKERESLFHDLDKFRDANLLPDIGYKLIGINFIGQKSANLRKITEARVMARGDNHQSIKAATNPVTMKKVMGAFLNRFQPPVLVSTLENKKTSNNAQSRGIEKEDLVTREGSDYCAPDNKFDIMINVEVKEESSLENAKRIWKELQRFGALKLTEPTEEEWRNAYNKAIAYVPTFYKKMGGDDQKLARKAMYYGVRIGEPTGIVNLLKEPLQDNATWKSLQDRTQKEFHITLGHQAAQKDSQPNKEIWNELGRMFGVLKVRKDAQPNENKLIPHFSDVAVKKIVVVEGKLITLEVELPNTYRKDEDEYKGESLRTINKYLHITVATAEGISPMMSNVYLTELRNRFPDLTDGEYELTDAKVKVLSQEGSFDKQQLFIHFE